ncbi:MAG: AGE family epimerase/isomerase, partial [Rhodospirillales bacterium]|nr:AGE family epimerase/isomerase [Rhodospirillales bacterium]
MPQERAAIAACSVAGGLSLDDWLFDLALPFWTAVGFDDRHGGFFDRVDADGKPYVGDPKSTLTHGRQLYSFCHLFLMKPNDAAKRAADRAFGFLTDCLWDGADGGFYRSVGSDGDPAVPGVNPRKDAYDHAF